MKFSLCIPWRHVCESRGTASVSCLNLGTLPTLCVREEDSQTLSTQGWLCQKPVLMLAEQKYTFKDNASLCYTSAGHLAYLPSTKYRKSWG